jgi:hypothetical protein
MSPRASCDEVRELAPELALGIASGDERARALEHLSVCSKCRTIIEEMSDVSDELLLAAPMHEPPVGFESRMLDHYRGAVPGRRRRISLFLAAAAVLVALGAGGTYLALRSDVRFAQHYRSVFAAAQGEYFASSPLYSGERSLGNAFAYQGSPSWIFVVLDASATSDSYEVKVVTRAGREISLGSFNRSGPWVSSWGKALPVDLRVVSSLRLTPTIGNTLEAEFRRH